MILAELHRPALFAGTNNSDSSINKISSTSYSEHSTIVPTFGVYGELKVLELVLKI